MSRTNVLFFGVAAMFGLVLGLGLFTLSYGQGISYLSNDPAACANCHIMDDQYDSWTASSHAGVAVCVDCHLPHETIPKWIAKAENGWFHGVGFTLQNFPEPIRIKPRNMRVVQENCVTCHTDMVHEMLPATVEGESVSCSHCHVEVGHAAWR